MTGLEPAYNGITTQCRNHLATFTIIPYINLSLVGLEPTLKT